ncbi:Uncharacterised protein [Mycobacteroides abscessus subsp. abscessus]|uniref:hypothetical protein n=1 Tax=Mycobacteroides abscessus TaxID=36809 RepID=UPI00092B222D|nr:hypothetical protein [Mycobacteroides abscessus]SIJ22602.1 Uncharacterised protein [Mycobacteroides abscessus subsp. abscessus]SLH38131.1 Uncharacterised protein [Mycobacteroides abscessus subsp. abscessus]
MSAGLFDLALRVAARDLGGPVPRLVHNPAPRRDTRVAVSAHRVGRTVRVQAVGLDGRLESGGGSAGLSAIARAAGCATGDLGTGPTALVDSAATLRALASLAQAHADPSRCAGLDVASGSSLVGWWVERAAHPGTSAVTDVLAVSRQRFMLGVVPGQDSPVLWRRVFHVPKGLAGLHTWHGAVTAGPELSGLGQVQEDDDWYLAAHQNALAAQRSWDRPETLHIAAARLATRCDAADLYAAALLNDPLWRARLVHTGHVCHGEAIIGAATTSGRVVVRCPRLDTRLRAGSEVTGWPGDPMNAVPDARGRFTGEVIATSVINGALTVTIGGLRRTGYLPAAGEVLTVIPAPPSVSTIRSRRSAIARLYKRRFSWLSQGVTPAPVRRGVPLAVLIAAAEDIDGER